LVRTVIALPQPLFTFPLRALLMVSAASAACAAALHVGSRSAGLQISLACTTAFLAALVPMEDFAAWLHRTSDNLCALVYGLAVLLTICLVSVLPRYTVAQYGMQQRLRKLLFLALAGLFVIDLVAAVFGQHWR